MSGDMHLSEVVGKETGAALGSLGWMFVDAVWIGQVSWISAAFTPEDEDVARYVPASVARIHDLYLHAPVVTPRLITATMVALSLRNESMYGRPIWYAEGDILQANWPGSRRWSTNRRIRHGRIRLLQTRTRGVQRRHREVKRFLTAHLGHRVVAVTE